MLKLKTMGQLALTGASLNRPKPLALLAYLALGLGPEGVFREHLADLFWSSSTVASRRRQSLNDALYKLASVDSALVVASGNRLYPAKLQTDVGELHTAFRDRDLRALERLYQGPFLYDAEFQLEPSGELQDWLRWQRNALEVPAWELWLDAAELAFNKGDEALCGRYCATAHTRILNLPERADDFERLYRLLRAGRHPLGDYVASEASQLGLELSDNRFLNRRRSDRAAFVSVPGSPLRLVGRDQDCTTIMTALTLDNEPSVALKGMPGVGKTALALTIARNPELTQRFPDGVLWGSLGPGNEVSRVFESWARAFGIKVTHLNNQERSQALRDTLGYRRILFVVDDVFDAEAGTLLRCGGPYSAHLFTTRFDSVARALASHVHEVTPLTATESLTLFSSYAPEVCRYHAKACAELTPVAGGLPLALELFGKHLSTYRFLPNQRMQALTQLGHAAFRLNLSHRRIGDVHEQTLRDVINLSLQGLELGAQQAFSDLGAFASQPATFSVEAALDVTGTSEAVLGCLIECGLVEIRANDLLSIHPVISDLMRLQTFTAATERHLHHYLALVRKNPTAWTHVESYYPQLMWAWQKAPNTVRLDLLGALELFQHRLGLWQDRITWAEVLLPTEVGQSCVGALLAVAGEANLNLSRYAAARDQLRAAAEALRPKGGAALAGVLSALADTYRRLNHYEEAIAMCQQAQALADEPTVQPMNVLGLIYYELGRYSEAAAQFETALAFAAEYPACQAELLNNLGVVYCAQSKCQAAAALFERALPLTYELGDRRREAETLTNLGTLASANGNRKVATKRYEKALGLYTELADEAGQAVVLNKLGTVLNDSGGFQLALRVLETTLEFYKCLGDRRSQAYTLHNLGLSFIGLKQINKALTFFEQALTLRLELGDRKSLAATHSQLGSAFLSLGQREHAYRHFSHAEVLQRATGDLTSLANTLRTLYRLYQEDGKHNDAATTQNELERIS